MGGRRLLRTMIAWDVVLPFSVALAPIPVKLAFPKIDVAELAAVLALPMIAALLRAVRGAGQIREVCGGTSPPMRQMALGVAIVLLMLFESLVAILVLVANAPKYLWAFAALFYACYFATSWLALRSNSRPINLYESFCDDRLTPR